MQVDFIQTFHPLALFSLIALIAFVWGLQAALGANVGHRRDLEWQTAFLLGLLFSGILFVVFYSIRPLTNQSPVKTPVWIEKLGGRLPIILLGVAVSLAVIMELISFLPPVYLLAVPWFVFFFLGAVLSVLALVSFTCMGGNMGVKWLEKRSTREKAFGLSKLLPTWSSGS
jgi:hypothetical protein